MRRAHTVVAILSSSLPAASFVACSSSPSLPGLPPGYSPEASTVDGSILHPDSSGRTDGQKPDSKAACPIGPTPGGLIEELEQPGSTPPALGGTIANGTYVLEHIYSYVDSHDAGGGTPVEEQKTLVIQGTSYIWEQASGTVEAGVGTSATTSGDYKTSGSTLTFTQSCPGAASGVEFPYTAAGTGLSIYTDGKTIEFYGEM